MSLLFEKPVFTPQVPRPNDQGVITPPESLVVVVVGTEEVDVESGVGDVVGDVKTEVELVIE